MATHPSPVDVSSPASIAAASFTQSRRGYDRDEVRALLNAVASELARAQEANARLSDELADLRASGGRPPLDEATVTGLVGEETAHVLATAREAAGQIRAKAEESMARILREAQDDAARLREDAAVDAARRRQEASDAAAEEIEAAKHDGRQMVTEARAVRERMLSDLTRRRDAARAQLERIHAERARLVAAFDDAGRAVDDVIAGLRAAAPESTVVETVEEAVVAVATGEVAAPEGVEAAEPEPTAVAEPEAGERTPFVPVIVEPIVENSEPEPVSVFVLGEEPQPSAPSLSYAGELEPELAMSGDAPTAAEPPSNVESLFARLRAANTGDVAADASVANGDVEPADDDGEGPPPEPTVDLLAVRAEALGPVQASLARRIKRALADEQNEVLDALRRASAQRDATALLGDKAAYGERYRAVSEDDLWTAATLGAGSLVDMNDEGELHATLDRHRVLDASLDDVVADLATPLRARLEECLDRGDLDEVETGTALRAAYREWKTQRVDELAGRLALAAHGHGAFAALDAGTPIHWVVDPDGPPCPDADDNALAGTIAAGEPFPTGHCHAPAHPGCRCGIARTGG